MISLLSYISKIVLHIMRQRMEPYATTFISEEQAGFVKGKENTSRVL